MAEDDVEVVETTRDTTVKAEYTVQEMLDNELATDQDFYKAVLKDRGIKFDDAEKLTAESVRQKLEKEAPYTEQVQKAVANYNSTSNVADYVLPSDILNRQTGDINLNALISSSNGKLTDVELHRLIEAVRKAEEKRQAAAQSQRVQAARTDTVTGERLSANETITFKTTDAKEIEKIRNNFREDTMMKDFDFMKRETDLRAKYETETEETNYADYFSFRTANMVDQDGNQTQAEALLLTKEGREALKNGYLKEEELLGYLKEMGYDLTQVYTAKDKDGNEYTGIIAHTSKEGVAARYGKDSKEMETIGFLEENTRDYKDYLNIRKNLPRTYKIDGNMEKILNHYDVQYTPDGQPVLKLNHEHSGIPPWTEVQANQILSKMGLNAQVGKNADGSPNPGVMLVVPDSRNPASAEALNKIVEYDKKATADALSKLVEVKQDSNGDYYAELRSGADHNRAANLANKMGFKEWFTENDAGDRLQMKAADKNKNLEAYKQDMEKFNYLLSVQNAPEVIRTPLNDRVSNIQDHGENDKNTTTLTDKQPINAGNANVQDPTGIHDIYLDPKDHDKEMMKQYNIPQADNLEDFFCQGFVNIFVWANDNARLYYTYVWKNAQADKKSDRDKMRREMYSEDKNGKVVGDYAALDEAVKNGDIEKAKDVLRLMSARSRFMGKDGKQLKKQTAAMYGTLEEIGKQNYEGTLLQSKLQRDFSEKYMSKLQRIISVGQDKGPADRVPQYAMAKKHEGR